jgi:hypothetical protein
MKITPRNLPDWLLIPLILFVTGATAVLYYRLVWGVIPELVIALDHCRDLYCDFTRQYYPTAREVLISGQPSRGYFYSSFFALLLAPFGRLELEPAVGWWSLVQLAGILLLLLPGVDFYRQSRAAFALYVVLLAFSMPSLHNLACRSPWQPRGRTISSFFRLCRRWPGWRCVAGEVGGDGLYWWSR